MCFYLKISQRLSQDEHSSIANLQSHSRNHKALKTIRNLIIIYAVCVFPARLFAIMRQIKGLFKEIPFESPFTVFNSLFKVANAIFNCFWYSNNVLNVLVYAKMIKGFRRFLCNLLTLGVVGRRKRSASSSSANSTVMD